MNTPAPDVDFDALYLGEALRLGKRGRFVTAPNPCVGAVLVKD